MDGKLKTLLGCLVLTLGLAVAASAQQSSSASQDNNKMMQNCHSNMQKMTAENGQAKKQIEEAKTSKDPTKMRAALDQAEKSLDSMNSHMKMCMNMMGNMKGMHGMMSDQQKTPKTDKPNEPPK
jgi:uncharacterized protein HemX